MSKIFSILALTATVLATATPNLEERGFLPDGRFDIPLVASTGGMQKISDTPKAPGTFSNGLPPLLGEPDKLWDSKAPDVYGARDIDIPIGRYFHGHLNFFPTINDPKKDTSVWGSDHDSAEQSACGIPANAYFISGVAIHPYFLKYAGLDRYCMQDVCVWFWKDDGSVDMVLKVTDICTPDSVDGVPCLDPMDIKIDRTKASIIMNNGKSIPQGNQYPEKVWWLFTKCWADGLAQPAYQNNSNWFTDPFLPNNDDWVQSTAYTQMLNNQKTYPTKGWEIYPNGLFNISRYAKPIGDYDPNNLPDWKPIAGGRGCSIKTTPPMGSHPAPSSSKGSAPTLSQYTTQPAASSSEEAAPTTSQVPSPSPLPESSSYYVVETTYYVQPLPSSESEASAASQWPPPLSSSSESLICTTTEKYKSTVVSDGSLTKMKSSSEYLASMESPSVSTSTVYVWDTKFCISSTGTNKVESKISTTPAVSQPKSTSKNQSKTSPMLSTSTVYVWDKGLCK